MAVMNSTSHPYEEPTTQASQPYQPVHDAESKMIGLERGISAYLRDMQKSFDMIKLKANLEDETVRHHEMELAFQGQKPFLEMRIKQVSSALNEIQQLLDLSPPLKRDYFDSHVTVDTAWSRLSHAWGILAKSKPVDLYSDALSLVSRLSILHDQADEIRLHIARLTLPQRIGQHMKTIDVGRKVNLLDIIGDEMPMQPDRQARLLDDLRLHGVGIINGVIDPLAATAVRIDAKSWRRLLGLAMVFAIVVLGGVAAVGVADRPESASILPLVTYSAEPGTNAERMTAFLFIYLAVLAGSVFHMVVDFVKRQRDTDPLQHTGILFGDLTRWIHLHEVPMVVWAFSIWLGTGAAVYLVQDAVPVNYLTAALVGYSLDSVLDIVLARFAEGVAPKIAAIQARFAATTTPEQPL
jgi:uncharacterized membrane protein HdeD (DUF308 family)